MQHPLRFSLVLGTVGRTDELYRLFDSLSGQTYPDFEVIIVDQNPGNELSDVLASYQDRLSIQHLRSARGLSKARNVGLRQATGDIVAFPDDDCWYSPDLLERVAAQLEGHPEWTALTGRAISASGDPSNGRWDQEAGLLSQSNVWRRAISFSMFFRRPAIAKCRFDESLGVGAGTPWGAGEETDFLLQLLAQGNRIYYDPTLTVFHPEWGQGPYTESVCAKASSYGRGVGRVLRKHAFPLPLVGYHLIRPLGGTLLTWLSGRHDKARYHWSIFSGRAFGWWYGNPSPAHQALPAEQTEPQDSSPTP